MISSKQMIFIYVSYPERHRCGRRSQEVCGSPLSSIYVHLDSRLNQATHQLSQHRVWFIQGRDGAKGGLLRQT
jgi:hypothetical protein